ncbi:MAG: OmpA family protein [Prevotella sp.]|nr:OmpA family protein [Prevotella sp.]
MRKYLYLLLASLILMGCSAEHAMKKGDKYYALGEYFDAATQYKRAYAQTPVKEKKLRGQRALKLADCYRRINYTQRAIAAYRNALRYGQQDSLTQLYLGQQLLKAGSYKEATKVYGDMLIDSVAAQSPAFVKILAQSGMRSARQAPDWKKEGSRYTVKRENIFNSRRSEYSPVLGGDANDRLYFTSTRNEATGDELSGITGTKNGDIFVAQKDEQGKWQRPQVIDSELNSADDEGACCLTPDGHTMYLTVCRTDNNYPRYAKIASSRRSDAAWTKAQEVELTRDTLSLFAHPAVSPDGKWLYFVSDMPGGEGGKDIWRVRLSETSMGGVENLGAPVNTPGDELFPTFRPNGDLYFSSNGHEGMGGLDIFIAKPNAFGWQLEHPGFPLNSQGDDFGMTFEGMLNKGFFSSNRGDAHGWDHIYSFENPEIIQTVKGWVYEQEGYELPQAIVYLVGNDGTNLKLSVKGDGSFTQQIKPNVDYVLLGTCVGYLNHKEELRVEPAEDSEEYVLQFPLASITAPVLIDNIFYDFDKATLRPESTEALDKLVVLLNENPHVAIELAAHCDYKGGEEYNIRLSQRRAESVINYLIKKGIAKARLKAKGYGKGSPKKIRKKLTEKYTFLKENDVLTEDYVRTFTPEEQEICNQLNRRTEFRVTSTTYGMFDKEGRLIESTVRN